MRNNLRLYHMVLRQLCQWLPGERITRQRNLALLVTGLYLSASVHLSKVVRQWPVAGRLPSLVNRLHRFLCNERVSSLTWYGPIAQHILLHLGQHRLRLVIDTTQVGFGHRALVVGIGYRRRTLPLVWSLHRGQIGNVAVTKIIALLEAVESWLAPGCTVELTADTSFSPTGLLYWLNQHGWHYVIRQRAQTFIRYPKGDWVTIGQLSVVPGQTLVVGWVWLAKTNPYGLTWLVIHWAKGEKAPWILASDMPEAKTVIHAYRCRMWIEEMFGDLKRHGFDLQATHLRDEDRIERLMLAVCITFVWLICLGAWVVKNSHRQLIDHKSRRDKSYFRLGWDWVERCMRLDLPLSISFKPQL